MPGNPGDDGDDGPEDVRDDRGQAPGHAPDHGRDGVGTDLVRALLAGSVREESRAAPQNTSKADDGPHAGGPDHQGAAQNLQRHGAADNGPHAGKAPAKVFAEAALDAVFTPGLDL